MIRGFSRGLYLHSLEVVMFGNTGGNRLQTAEETVESAASLTCRVSTNCPCGGDAGHGGVTTVEFCKPDGMAWGVGVDFRDRLGVRMFDDPSVVRIVVEGDSEAANLIELLRFAANTLEAMTNNIANARYSPDQRPVTYGQGASWALCDAGVDEQP